MRKLRKKFNFYSKKIKISKSFRFENKNPEKCGSYEKNSIFILKNKKILNHFVLRMKTRKNAKVKKKKNQEKCES